MKPRILFIGTPCHDGRVHQAYASSLVKLTACNRYSLRVTEMSGGGVCVARNKITHAFLNCPDADRILWIDSDIQFTPEDVDALWDRNLPIVGGFYAHKTVTELRWSARSLGKEADPKTGLMEMAAMGTGFLMVQKRVFKEQVEATPGLRYIEDWADGKGQEKFCFFKDEVIQDPEAGYNDSSLLTEDWYFAYWARRLGYKVYGDTRVQLGHWEGGIRFPVQTVQEQQNAA